MFGIGGLFAPSASIIDPTGIAGANVVWLRQNALLAKDTGLVLEEGISYRLTFNVIDRLDQEWPGGVARLVAEDGTVLASADLETPVNGSSAEVAFPDSSGRGRSSRARTEDRNPTDWRHGLNQILVDEVRLDVLRPGDIEAANISNASFELDSLVDGAPNVNSSPLGNFMLAIAYGLGDFGNGGLFAPAASVIDPDRPCRS